MKLPIAENIRRLRREKNITQEELALKMGVTYQSVSRWENGQAYPDMELIPKIAEYFDVSTDLLFGTDRQSKENRIEKHYEKIRQVQGDLKEFYSACKEAYEEFPEEFSFGLWLCRCYVSLGILPYKDHLDEIREICKNILENCTVEDYRIEAIHSIIIAEDEERIDTWLDKAPSWKTCREVLLDSRYEHRNDPLKYMQKQKNFQTFLGYIFYNCVNESTPKDAIEGYITVLKLIDVMRDTAKEYDAWMPMRAEITLHLSSVYFNEGNREEGYTELEKAIDLYEKYAELPFETELSYNCVLFNMLKENKECGPESDLTDKGEYVCYWAYRSLTDPKGCFASIQGEERLKAIVGRLLPYLPDKC